MNSGTITVSATDNVVRISIVAKSGSVLVTGSSSFQGTPSNAVEFVTGEGVTITSPSVNNPIDGLTIDCSAGAAELVISTQ